MRNARRKYSLVIDHERQITESQKAAAASYGDWRGKPTQFQNGGNIYLGGFDQFGFLPEPFLNELYMKLLQFRLLLQKNSCFKYFSLPVVV